MKRLPHLSIAKVMPGMAAAALLSAGLSPMAPANAQTFSSFYTSTAPKDCHVAGARNGVDDSTIRLCPGKAGLKVLVSEDDLRESGRSAALALRR